MMIFRLRSFVIIIVLYNIINKNVSSSAIFPESSGDSHQDAGDVNSKNVNINLAVQSLNLKNVIRDEIISVLKDYNGSMNNFKAGNLEERSQQTAASLHNGFQKNNVSNKLDYITSKFQDVEKILKNIQAEKTPRTTVEQETTNLMENKYTLGKRYKTMKYQKSYPEDCTEVQDKGNNVSGIYEIKPKYSKEPFPVLCDMETRGGWTHIQKRFDGSQDFFLGWRDYKFGFGNLEGEFWLGLENIYLMTGFRPTELLVEIVSRDNTTAYAHYSSFGIGSEPGGYKLSHLAGYNGDAGDAMNYHLGHKFSTKDLDFTKKGCATVYVGAWWYHDCHWSNLNGKYINIDLPSTIRYKGLQWDTFKEAGNSHSKSRMLIRLKK